ncbi:peroxide stress protein YaaA [Aestuariibius insulae]|uniref:peroxide stress protein YaaA n=1 Tax=Aestuariibius insulae TaxID=2058287 RepID=UPI00345E84CA
MLIVLSPAKSLDWETSQGPMTTPDFAEDALRLAKTARQLTLKDLKSLMKVSDDLARLNRDRFRAFSADPDPDDLRPAALAFNGDTYQGLWAKDFSDADWAEADRRLRILSGLYGLLKPRDGIQPYRLEMGSRLKTRRGTSLYDYWGDDISKALKSQAKEQGTDILLNCASQEYFGAVAPKSLKLRVITPTFLEDRDGTAKTISFFAKRARGALARHVIQNRLTRPEDLASFEAMGYRYDPASSPEKPVFSRPYQAAA